MIVVLDSNVWVSAMHFRSRSGAPVVALERAINRNTIAICDGMRDEILRILTEKFHWRSSEVRARLAELLEGSLHVAVAGALRVCRDPNDDMVLECALNAGADVIVTGDKDLLVLGSYKGIRIMTPAEFIVLEAEAG